MSDRRALGRNGRAAKQVRPVDVSKVLYELHLCCRPPRSDEPASCRSNCARRGDKTQLTRRRHASLAPQTSQDWAGASSAVKQQSSPAALRGGDLDSLAARLGPTCACGPRAGAGAGPVSEAPAPRARRGHG